MRYLIAILALSLTSCATSDPRSPWCSSGCINDGLGSNAWYRPEDWGGKKPTVKRTVCHQQNNQYICEETTE